MVVVVFCRTAMSPLLALTLRSTALLSAVVLGVVMLWRPMGNRRLVESRLLLQGKFRAMLRPVTRVTSRPSRGAVRTTVINFTSMLLATLTMLFLMALSATMFTFGI